MNRRSPAIFLAALLLLATACGGDADTSGEMQDDPSSMESGPGGAATSMSAQRSVEITSPAEGEAVEGPNVTVELQANGFEVVEAGDTTANTGHHHLFLDRDVSPAGQPIPAEEGHIVHMGDGSEQFEFENVAPGDHTLIAVVGDGYHVPVPGLVDTIRFSVR